MLILANSFKPFFHFFDIEDTFMNSKELSLLSVILFAFVSLSACVAAAPPVDDEAMRGLILFFHVFHPASGDRMIFAENTRKKFSPLTNVEKFNLSPGLS